MFTGIVQDVGRVAARESRGGDLRLTVVCNRLDLGPVRVGDSICVAGCCLTVVEINGQSFAADLSRETLSVTTLGELEIGAGVNLEPALRAGEALGGHLVSGHIDGIGRVAAVREAARSRRLTIELPRALGRYLAPKGSVTVDGVSLTVNTAARGSFGVNIIPHTLTQTTLGALGRGALVNLEVDQVARYLERLMRPWRASRPRRGSR